VTSRKTLEALVQLKEEITAVRGGSSLVAVLAGNCGMIAHFIHYSLLIYCSG
jgi:hypothetical protein